MPLAKEVAIELRRIADSLDQEPETKLTRPMLSFYCDSKDEFLASARLLPRPINKTVTDGRYELEISRDGYKSVWTRSVCDRSKICTVVTPAVPAVYDCPSLLSEAEEASLTDSQVEAL